MRKASAVVLVSALLISGLFVFQCVNVVAYSSFSRSIVVAAHLLTVEFLDANHTELGDGIFALLLTFENPTIHTLNVTEIFSDYWIIQGSVSVFTLRGNTTVPIELSPGETQVVLPMPDVLGQFSPQEHFECIVYYRLKYGSAHYRFEYFAYDSIAQTTGPYLLGGEDPIFPQVATYTLLVIDSWAVGLEIIGGLILFQDRRSGSSELVPEDKGHSKMAAVIYALQGIGLFIFFPFVNLLESSVAPPTQAYSSAGGWTIYIFVGLVELAGLVFLLASRGLWLRKRTARYTAFFLSSISIAVALYACFTILSHLATDQDLALVTLSFATLAANTIAFYILLKR